MAGGATPMPKANEPVARWPSTAETVRHATVYTPSGRFGLERHRQLDGIGRRRGRRAGRDGGAGRVQDLDRRQLRVRALAEDDRDLARRRGQLGTRRWGRSTGAASDRARLPDRTRVGRVRGAPRHRAPGPADHRRQAWPRRPRTATPRAASADDHAEQRRSPPPTMRALLAADWALAAAHWPTSSCVVDRRRARPGALDGRDAGLRRWTGPAGHRSGRAG